MTDHPLPESLSPQEAWQLLQDDPRALLVDIRSTMEYLFVGHPQGAVHVAWIDEPEWTVNPHFDTEIRKLLLGGAVWAWVVGGTVFLLFGAMNFYTHIGMYYNIANDTMIKW